MGGVPTPLRAFALSALASVLLVLGVPATAAPQPTSAHAAGNVSGKPVAGSAARRCARGSVRRRSRCRVVKRAAGASMPLFGYNDNAVRAGRIGAEADAQLTQRSGANITRLAFDWRWVEPQRGNRRFAQYDEIYRAMRARGIRPLLILVFAPWWSWDSSVSCNQWTQECRYPPAREHYADWRSIASELATRYPDAAGIEVWNEPNSSIFWRSPDPARYTELLAETYRAVKTVAPSMPVISGGLADAGNVSGVSFSFNSFLKAMYQQGAARFMDGIGIHPYPSSLEFGPNSRLQQNMAGYRYIRNYFGDSRKPFWATEVGLTSSGPNTAMRLTEDQHANGLRSAYRALAGMSDVKAVVVHELVQDGSTITNINSGWGVVRPDLTPRKAFCALARERGRASCP